MSNEQQKTAVEWYANEVLLYKNPTNINGTDYILIPINKIEHLKEQAKEIEKERIKKAWADGNYNTDDDGNPSENYSISDEHYYEKTYGGNNG